MLSFFARLSIQPRLADGAESITFARWNERGIPVGKSVALAADRASSRESAQRSRRPSSSIGLKGLHIVYEYKLPAPRSRLESRT